MPEKVTDLKKIVTDELVLKRLAEQGIDKDYVELWHDYAPRSLGKEYSPYAKFYRDLKSNKRFMVVSGLPMVKPDGTKIEVGWFYEKGQYYSKPNLFSAVVDGIRITVVALSDQPSGAKEGDSVTWQPKLFLGGMEQVPGTVALLPICPTNPNLQNTTIEWDYGICKRRIRSIQGRLREKWIFESNPKGEVRIKHNHSGDLKLTLGKYGVNDDEEVVPTDVFNQAEYPLEIGASPETFHPDPHVESTSVDGRVDHEDTGGLTWHAIVTAVGTAATDDSSSLSVWLYRCDGISSKYDRLFRSIFLFNTSGLPDDAVISTAVLSIYGTTKSDGASIAPELKVYSSAPANNDALVAGDYDSFGSTALSSAVAWADWAGSYNDFTLIDVDADDFGYIGQGAGEAGMTKLGIRESKYDVADELDPNNHDPAWSSGNTSTFNARYAERGASQEPKLVVTYTSTYTEEAAVDVGIAPSASRSLRLARESSVEVGIEATADRQCVYHRYGWRP